MKPLDPDARVTAAFKNRTVLEQTFLEDERTVLSLVFQERIANALESIATSLEMIEGRYSK